jgi:hypothetical protein
MMTLKHMVSETYRTYIFHVFAVFGYIINLYYLACVCVCLFSSLLNNTAFLFIVFIEPKHTLISINKCYCNNKFSCFPLYNMSGCRLLISRWIYMKLHCMKTGYIYASVGIKKMNCYLMMTRKERIIEIRYIQDVNVSRIDRSSIT